MRLVRTGGRDRLEISRREWERVGAKAGWPVPRTRPEPAPEGSLICSVCGELVPRHDLRVHLELHNPNARGMDLEDVRDCYFRKASGFGAMRKAAEGAASVEIRPYGNRFFAVYVDGELLAVTVYKKGALAVGGLVDRLWKRIEDAEGRIRFRGLETA